MRKHALLAFGLLFTTVAIAPAIADERDNNKNDKREQSRRDRREARPPQRRRESPPPEERREARPPRDERREARPPQRRRESPPPEERRKAGPPQDRERQRGVEPQRREPSPREYRGPRHAPPPAPRARPVPPRYQYYRWHAPHPRHYPRLRWWYPLPPIIIRPPIYIPPYEYPYLSMTARRALDISRRAWFVLDMERPDSDWDASYEDAIRIIMEDERGWTETLTVAPEHTYFHSYLRLQSGMRLYFDFSRRGYWRGFGPAYDDESFYLRPVRY